MKTLGDILDGINTPYDLLKIRNFGRKSLFEIEAVLNQIDRKDVVAVQDKKNGLFHTLDDRIAEIITAAYSTVTRGDSEMHAFLKETFPQPSDLHDFVMGELDNMLKVVEGYSREENVEIRRFYKRYIDLVLGGMEQAQEVENNIYLDYKQKSKSLASRMEYFNYEQIAKYFLSAVDRDYLQRIYQEQMESELSTKSKYFVETYYPHFSDVIKYFEKPLSAYQKFFPTVRLKKTLTEIYLFNQHYKDAFDKVLNLSDNEVQQEVLKKEYPYLVSSQRQFVSNFTRENNHPPLFFLLYHYLRLSEEKSNKIYSLLYGIFDGKQRTLDEVATMMNYSSERVRQISYKTEVKLSPLVKNDGWKYYNELFELPYISEKSDEYVRMTETEHLPVGFEVFASLVRLVAGYKILDVEGHIILIKNNIGNFKFSDCLNLLSNFINAKYSVDTYVPIETILRTVPKPLKPLMKTLIKQVAAEKYNVKITNDEKLYLPQNYIDVVEELYDILAKNGKPMHVDDIFEAFKAKYPDHKYTDPLQIKTFLFKHPHIKPVGMTSCYALDSWEGIYFGSIRDLLVDLLSASDIPLHIDNLYKSVIVHYPNTSKSSLSATMQNDNSQRFVEFEGGLFGLTSKNYPEEYVEDTSSQRYPFEERLQMFKDFVETYHRFPNNIGGELEASLQRWFYRASADGLEITEDQKKKLDEIAKGFDELGYPRTSTEHEFLLRCQEVKKYIRQNHALPSNSKAPELWSWLRRSVENYDSYTDKRRRYMTDLLNDILSFGFSI